MNPEGTRLWVFKPYGAGTGHDRRQMKSVLLDGQVKTARRQRVRSQQNFLPHFTGNGPQVNLFGNSDEVGFQRWQRRGLFVGHLGLGHGFGRCGLGSSFGRWLGLVRRSFCGAALGLRKLLAQLQTTSLSAWQGQDLGQAHAAAAALLGYAEHTQGRSLSHVQSLHVERDDRLIELPAATRRNLELTQTLRGEDSPTLFSLLDTCMTGMGSRTLKQWLLEPQRDRTQALQRLEAIAALQGLQGHGPWRNLRENLKGMGDVQRISARIALRQVRPRELVALGLSLNKSWQVQALVPESPWLDSLANELQAPPDCAELLGRALLPEPAALVRDGGVIGHGFDAELDELRAIQNNCDDFLLDLEVRERARTGIANLRVQYNKVHGFYIEVTQGQLDRVPEDYRRRQTLKNAERFITPELKAFEDKALSAQERGLARENGCMNNCWTRCKPSCRPWGGWPARWPPWTPCAPWPSARSR